MVEVDRKRARLETAMEEELRFHIESIAEDLVRETSGLVTFGWARLNRSNWMLSSLQCAVFSFLRSNLYIRIKQWKLPAASISAAPAMQGQAQEYTTQFAVRAGSRIKVVYENSVLWISAARDYA